MSRHPLACGAGLVVAIAVALSSCGRSPTLPRGDGRAAVDPPEIPGVSEEFKNMAIPPAQLARALPVGTAWGVADGPTYRSRCLACHCVSQTAFAVTDWQESLHARAGVLCAACHGSHEASFVPQPGPDRCLLCHAPQVEEFLASKHGPDRSAGMRCVSCHEPHATDRGLVRAAAVCRNCHLDSAHVQDFATSRMGLILAEHPPSPDGALRAANCVTCHMPPSPAFAQTGDFRNDRLTLHDPSVTVRKAAADSAALAPDAIEFLVPICTQCHSERNTRYRLANSDPLVKSWTPLGMTGDVRRRPIPAAGAASGARR
jgi:hypothetical protein